MSEELIRARYEIDLKRHISLRTGEEPKEEDIVDECEQLAKFYGRLREGKFRGKIQRLLGKMQSHLIKSRKKSKIPPKIKLSTGPDLWRLIQDLPLSFRAHDCVCYEPASEWINPLGMKIYCHGRPRRRSKEEFCRDECPYSTEFIRVLLRTLLSWKEAQTKSGFSFYRSMRGLGEPSI